MVKAASHFCLPDSIKSITAFGNGLINSTYLVECSDLNFVLQKINTDIFSNPELILQNVDRLHQAAERMSSDQSLIIPAYLHSHSGPGLYEDFSGASWRAMEYVKNSASREAIRSIEEAQQVGKALARFHNLCREISVNDMHITLPGFHHTPDYLATYLQVEKKRREYKAQAEIRYCQQSIEKHKAFAAVLEKAKQAGELKPIVIHGDPKLNNFLFAKDTDEVISLVDLDTVQPGLIHYDVGDCVRSCCHQKPGNQFDMELCEVILMSYLKTARPFLSRFDINFIPAAIKLIPFELGIRFFTDFLNGNTYFEVKHPHQNLHRAVAQFELLNAIIRQEALLQKIVEKEN